jgi:RNA chaperone Hfq
METNLLDRMLDSYLSGKVPVTVTLQNKIRVSGKIRAFDSYVIVMENQTREIVYRHAVSSVSPHAHEEQKRQPAPVAARQKPETPPQPKPFKKAAPHKPRPAHQPSPPVLSAGEPGLSNTMKDGLLKWMQEHKAAK